MKKLLVLGLLAGLVFSACSNDDSLNESQVKEGEDGFVAFNIQLPTQLAQSTRSNDEFNDGNPIPDEYKVLNAYLFFFTGANEAAATFCGAYQLDIQSFATSGSATDQCTSEGIASQKITKPTVATNLYAYVLLNNNDIVTAADATSATFNSNSITTTTTFADFSKMVLAKLGNTTTGLVMTNAIVSSKVGGATSPKDAVISTLATVDAEKIYPTKSQAEANPAAEIYVERAAVKVTVSKSSSITGALTSDPTVTYDASSIQWALYNENQTYYNTRQWTATANDWLELKAITKTEDDTKDDGATSDMYRFVSGSAIHAGVYRTYFGEDVNYNADVASGVFKTAPTASEITNALDASVYTFENTFDVDRQTSKNTTGVQFVAEFNDGYTFYTANTYGSSKLLQIPSYTGTAKKVQDYISEYLQANNTEYLNWYNLDPSKNIINVTMDDDATTGTSEVLTVTPKTGYVGTFPASITPALINASIKFKYFADGKVYYTARIKHFGAELSSGTETPWTVGNHSVNNIAGVYKTIGSVSLSDAEANRNYLGRYGVLRNNWYQIEVSGIREIGTPIPGDPVPGNPDDEVENYISVKIHVLPWALRKQSVIL